MVGAVERIAQEIAALDKETSAIADAFYSAYSTYLAVLGQAVRQQLILASYHVCTQGYPEAFLRLSYSQRQQLQQRLRTLAQHVQEEIAAQLHKPVAIAPPIDRLALEPVPDTDQSSISAWSPDEPLAIASPPPQSRSLTPTDLAYWREELEHAIVAELKTASHAANRLLQQAQMLPQTLPERILEAATNAEMSDARVGTPNVLNLLVATDDDTVETEPSDEADGRSVMPIIAICLRRSEIEFADPVVAAARSKLRSLFAQLQGLGRDYQKKQHEQSIAEAQAAWRSSWTEE
ncbi:hypothetical protein [Stenomitos frigidus]|uniref:Uncharacterized protein n=1 Tax=Stenomitos frigidus ULC18 TaxID=2107698 RepID=A0A2T1E092_9CYAN|nr:hypothetical protein [Stenomitos frigidus]PSB26034.1 hypothetical protein C7B82_21285 [Stenomitos frigidus ULC18]